MPSKFLNLSTDDTLGGNSPSDVVAVSQKAIKKYVDDHSGGGGSVSIDNKSITTNTSNQLQTVGVIDQNNTSTALKVWHGTQAEYDALATHDANTRYYTDGGIDTSLLEVIYPVGSIYITTNAACPLSTLITGSTWVLVGQDRVLQGAGTRGAVGTALNESLPNITGSWTGTFIEGTNPSPSGSGAFSEMEHSKSGSYYGGGFINNPNWNISSNGGEDYTQLRFDASLSASTYQDDAPVQPDAYLVNIYRRTA